MYNDKKLLLHDIQMLPSATANCLLPIGLWVSLLLCKFVIRIPASFLKLCDRTTIYYILSTKYYLLHTIL